MSSTLASSPRNPSSHGHHSSTQSPSALHPRRQLPRVPPTTASTCNAQQHLQLLAPSATAQQQRARNHGHRDTIVNAPASQNRSTMTANHRCNAQQHLQLPVALSRRPPSTLAGSYREFLRPPRAPATHNSTCSYQHRQPPRNSNERATMATATPSSMHL